MKNNTTETKVPRYKTWFKKHPFYIVMLGIIVSVVIMWCYGFPRAKNQDIPYGIIAALIIAIITCYDKWKKDTLKGFFKNNLIAGGLLIAAFWALYFTYKADVKNQNEKVASDLLNKKLQEKIKAGQDTISTQGRAIKNISQNTQTLILQTLDSLKKQLNQTKQNLSIASSLMDKSNELISAVSSKDSYVVLELVNVDKVNNFGNLMPIGVGKHPVRLFSYYIYDLDTHESISSSYMDITVFPQMTGSYNPNIRYRVNPQTGVKWNIFIQMSGGSYCEELRLDYVNHTGSVKLYDNNFFKSNKNAGKCVYSNDSYKKS